LVEQLPSIIYVDDVNVEGRTLYISPQIETILGFTPQEWMDKSPGLWTQQVHPDDLEWVHAEYMRCLQDGKPLDCEYRIRSSNGRLLWFRDQAALLRDENGRPHLIQGMIYDISERKQVEQAAHQRVLELELLYESGLAFIQLLHPNEIAQKVIDLLEQKMYWHHTAIRLYDRETDTLQLLAFNQAA
jgi:PAS domain S-box-containing protein